MSAEEKGAGLQQSEEHPGEVPRGLNADVTLTLKLGGKCPVGKEDGWGGEEAVRQARELVRLLERRVLSAEVWY